MTILQIEYFLEVVKQGSFQAAAKTLYVSQQGISRQIAAIEKEIGFALLDRSNKRQMHLTREGEFLYTRWNALIRDYQDALTEAQILSGKRKKKIRIGIYEAGPVIDYVMPLINGYRVSHPECDVECLFSGEEEIMNQLENGELEMVFAFCAKYRDYSISSFPIYYDRACVALSRNHRFAAESQMSPQQIAEEPLYVLDPSYSYDAWENTKSFLQRNGLSGANMVPVKDLNNLEMILNTGKGIAIAPRIMLRNTNHEIVFCPMEGPDNADAISLYAIWKNEKQREDVMSVIGRDG